MAEVRSLTSGSVTLFRDNLRSAELEEIRGLPYSAIRARKRADCPQRTDLPPAARLIAVGASPLTRVLSVTGKPAAGYTFPVLDRQALTRLPTTPAAKRRRTIALGAGAAGTQGPQSHSPTSPKGASDSHRRKYRSPYSISCFASSGRNSSCNHTRRWCCCWFAICSIALSGLPVCCQLFLGFRRRRLHPRLTSNAAARLLRMARPPSAHRCRLWVSPTPQPASHPGSVHVLPSHTHRDPNDPSRKAVTNASPP